MDSYGQSVFGGLGKKKKKKRNKNKSPHHKHHHASPGSDKRANEIASSPRLEKSEEHADVPQGEIRFVLPRSSSNNSSDKLKQFLFPRQLQQFARSAASTVNEDRTDEVNLANVEELNPINESIDDILFPGLKSKAKKQRMSADEASSEVLKQSSKKQKIKDASKDKDGSTQPKIKPADEGAVTSLIDTAEKGVTKKKSKSKQKSTGEEERDVDFTESNIKILARSVEDAIKDKVGRRPRANSTDGELNLPQRGLCDERIVLQSHMWNMQRLYNVSGLTSSTTPPPRGFVNLGNTCFLNATLQCLVYMPSFCQSITTLPPSCYDTNGNGRILHGQRITMALRSLARLAHGITAMEKNEPPRAKPIAPKTIHNLITSCKTSGHRFRPGRQEDAHELLVHLLDAMHEGELFAAGINPHASGWRDRLPIPRLDETTFVHRIFGGYFRSQLRCGMCGYKSNTYDPFLDLALEVSKNHLDELSSAFKEFTRKETLDSDNRWKCSGCKKMVCPTKHLSVFRPPLSLCIQLKRFVFGGGGFSKGGGWGYGHRHGKGLSMMGNGGSKISKNIDFPAQLSLPLSDGRACEYILTGVIVHVGNSATSGHYTAYVKQPGESKRWNHMDDSFVEVVSEKTVLKQRDAYVLFYSRKEVKVAFPQPPPREPVLKNGMKSKTSELESMRETQNDSLTKKAKVAVETSNAKAERKAKQPINSTSSSTPISTESQSSLTSPISDLFALKHAHEANPSSESESEVSSSGSGMSSPSLGSSRKESRSNTNNNNSNNSNNNNSNNSNNSSSNNNNNNNNNNSLGGVKRSLSFSNEHKSPSPHESKANQTPPSKSSVSSAKSISNIKKSTIEKKMQGNNVEVVLSRSKKKNAWKPPEATKINSCDDNNNVLLGNIAVSNWDDNSPAENNSTNKESLREMATKAMEKSDRSRKRNLHLDRWDAMIDEGKRKKVKVKNPDNDREMKKFSDSFQRIQRDMQRRNKGKAKGYKPTTDATGRVGSYKKKKQKSVQRS